ncbi:Anti-sigma regulatory factor (Ser/Thr protein kinase) [Streptomyces sp. DvalAA-14]|uniref:ATP-binding protein n=1 Tax=unclassified Streptomyces TaxID=2593676 RepID=UPI00081B695D|nr:MULTISPECIES: ATP-binding protein [unclassified Streptomyces]MYS23536.1 ATP-binding protein [Streptomyces sp. SID4948]SCE34885.1 Anti-sigma regulatory factor (Ser/Thr protein kinase) [Streptomyces sp. DvalAA-14]
MTTVEPPCDAENTFPASAAAARGRVRTLLAGHLPLPDGELPLADRVVTDVLLVTSELVTNAIRHGGGVTGFTATVEDGCLYLTVSDASSARPVRSGPVDHNRPGGYGWPLVCAVAEYVTVTPHAGGGKSVSVRVRLG